MKKCDCYIFNNREDIAIEKWVKKNQIALKKVIVSIRKPYGGYVPEDIDEQEILAIRYFLEGKLKKDKLLQGLLHYKEYHYIPVHDQTISDLAEDIHEKYNAAPCVKNCRCSCHEDDTDGEWFPNYGGPGPYL